ncbi:MAG: D-alanyl-D-alanine carboxypeptidase [Chloroflexi bacterium]|nr:D-alanyl-D-alanine carboxypeptidase [Chloroflexota bacterium]MBV9896050.1 D-alanyl-D-alanine carboxypeptidase [Chloroflexota bacterium]
MAIGLVVLAACDTATPPAQVTQVPAVNTRVVVPTPVVVATPAPPTLVPTPLPPTAVPPTPVPPTAVPPTPRPTVVPTEPATPTAVATPDPDRVQQQQYCDTAAPPAHVALPPLVPIIQITPPGSPSQAIAATGGPHQVGTDPAPHVTAPHVAVLDEASGALLDAVDPFAREAPASITKIATTIVAIEHQPDIKHVYTTTVSSSALVACDGSSVMGLEPDDHVTLETLLYGMMLPSGNDAAEQVAYSLAGSRETYVAWMNEEVASLHLQDTHFVTPSGMDADNHYSSAYDMALLARYAMRNPEFRTLAASKSFVGDDYYMHNLNPMLYSYAGADGVKIGYTDIAGRTIVASATRDGHRVYVSLMGSKNLQGDCTALFDWVWHSFQW